MTYDYYLNNVNQLCTTDNTGICNDLKSNLDININNKITITKINFDTNKSLPEHWKKNEIKNELFGFCLGQKKILNNKILFYCENFINPIEYINKGYTKEVGIILIEHKGVFKNWLKVYESEIDSYYFLESFLFDNYIFLIQTNDSGYDVYYPGKEKKIKYKYLVFEILQDGVIRKIIESKAKKIKNKYLDKK